MATLRYERVGTYMIKFKLTREQDRMLRRHFEMIRAASQVEQRGIFVAQIHKEAWDDRAYVRAHFIPGNRATKVAEAVSSARLPNCYAGIPSVGKT